MVVPAKSNGSSSASVVMKTTTQLMEPLGRNGAWMRKAVRRQLSVCDQMLCMTVRAVITCHGHSLCLGEPLMVLRYNATVLGGGGRGGVYFNSDGGGDGRGNDSLHQ